MSQTQYKLMSCSCNRPDHMFLISGGSSAIFPHVASKVALVNSAQRNMGRFYVQGLEATLNVPLTFSRLGPNVTEAGLMSASMSPGKNRPKFWWTLIELSHWLWGTFEAESSTLPLVSDTWWCSINVCWINNKVKRACALKYRRLKFFCHFLIVLICLDSLSLSFLLRLFEPQFLIHIMEMKIHLWSASQVRCGNRQWLTICQEK